MLMNAASQITIIKLIILSLAIFAVDSPMRNQHPGHVIFVSQSEASIWSSQVQSSPCPAEVLWMVFMGISIREGSWL